MFRRQIARIRQVVRVAIIGVQRRQGARVAIISVLVSVIVVALVALYRFGAEVGQLSRRFNFDSGPQATLVFDRHLKPVFSFRDEERIDRTLEELSPEVVNAVLAAEDRRFYAHAGLDPRRMMAALWANLKAQRVVQGGSTITQQLVRLSLLSPDRTVARKFREILLAIKVDAWSSKRKILETYLNRVYLGEGYFGVEAAARGYFGKSASELSAPEAALLAGLIRCPSACSPRAAPGRARARRNFVLRAMWQQGWLTAPAYAAAVASPVKVAARRHDEFSADHAVDGPQGGCALYFMQAVRRQLVAQFGEERVNRDGLRVFTTIDFELQQQAEETVARGLADLDSRRGIASGQPKLEGSLVAVDPHTGDVLALVGGRDFHESPFDRATQARRQPGSAFKPFVFAAALERGFTPSSVLADLDTPIAAAEGPWLPAGEHEAATYTLRRALTVSSNRAAAQLMQRVGVSTTVYYARRLGIESTLPAVPSLALGTADVTLLELTAAYGTFANNGIAEPPSLIRRVEDRWGGVLWQENRPSYRAIDPATAFLMSSMLADVVNRGTGSGARALGFKLPGAGKTGTTDGFSDAWFIGYTPKLVAGVWVGLDRPAPIMRRGFAATVAVPMWAQFMRRATEHDKPAWFEPPSNVERVAICRISGLRASEGCRLAGGSLATSGSIIAGAGVLAPSSEPGGVVEEWFALGTAPTEVCPIHPAGFALQRVDPSSNPSSDGRPEGGVSLGPRSSAVQ